LISSKIEGVMKHIRYGVNYGGLYGEGHFGKFETSEGYFGTIP